MRAANYSSMNIYNQDQIKEINSIIRSNFVAGRDNFASKSNKTSEVKFVLYGNLQKYIGQFVDFCFTAN